MTADCPDDFPYEPIQEPQSSATRARYWHTAMGLQDMDDLRPSPYARKLAREHIEGIRGIEETGTATACSTLTPHSSRAHSPSHSTTKGRTPTTPDRQYLNAFMENLLCGCAAYPAQPRSYRGEALQQPRSAAQRRPFEGDTAAVASAHTLRCRLLGGARSRCSPTAPYATFLCATYPNAGNRTFDPVFVQLRESDGRRRLE